MSVVGAALIEDDPIPTLRNEWAQMPISDLVSNKSGDSKLIKGKLFSSPGPGLFPAFSAAGQDVWRDSFDYEDEAIILSAVGARCGKCFYTNGKWSAIANTHVIRPNHKLVSTRFLWFILNDEQFWIRGGSAQPFVRVKKSLERTIWLPPLAEQKRIVSKVDELFSDIEAGERALARAREALARYRKSILKAAVTGALTKDCRDENKDKLEPADKLLDRILKARRAAWEKAELAKLKAKGKEPKSDAWKKKYKEATQPKIGAEFSSPQSWAKLSLEQATSANRPIAYGVLQPGKHFNGGTKLVRVCDVADGRIDESDIKEIDPKIANKFGRTFLSGDEVLLTLVGTIGRSAVVPKSLAGANVARAVGVLVLNDGIDPRWLEFCLRSEQARQTLVKNSREVARKTLNIEQVREYCVPVPPLAEQTEIVSLVEEAFSKAGHVEAALDEQRRAARALKQSILKAAFEGRLVPQDPADEPAAKLLEGINANRNQK